MTKKTYQAPAIECIDIMLSGMLADSLQIVEGNAGFNYGGGGNGAAHSRQGGDWEDEE